MYRVTSIVPYVGILAIILIIMKLGPADAAIGYYCGGTIRNMTTISLLDIDDCDLKIDDVEESTEEIALLQLNKFEHIKIDQCKIEISRIIFYCGFLSYSSLVSNGLHSYIESISREDCRNAIKYGFIKLRGILIFGLKPDQIDRRSLTFAGSIKTDDGSCSGGEYKDPFGSWHNVVATGTVTIYLTSKKATVEIEDNKIILPSGYQCKLSKGECLDPVGGYTFWDPLPQGNCTSKTYTKLYKGAATKLVSNDETVYTVSVTDTSFSFTVAGPEISCDITLLKTESSKLFIVDSNNLQHLENTKIVEKLTDNMDIFQYVNAKFVYVERHIRSQVKSLYADVMKHSCKLEKEILKNTLAIASTQPDEFAFRYMDGPGYMAVLAGEVIHVLQCIPVEVTYAQVDKCYNRLPVMKGNDTMFLMPRTHILTKSANEIHCNPALLEHYKLEGVWYKLTPKPVNTPSPLTLKPSTEMTWTYENLANLAQSGIYTQEDLDSIRDRIMNPVEVKVIRETLSQQFSNGMEEPVSITKIFYDYVRNQLFSDIWSIIWGPFSWFGSVASGFIGVFVVLLMFKFLVDFIINGYSLYLVHGWSIRLFSALWISLVNLSHLRTEEEERTEDEEIELIEKRKTQK